MEVLSHSHGMRHGVDNQLPKINAGWGLLDCGLSGNAMIRKENLFASTYLKNK